MNPKFITQDKHVEFFRLQYQAWKASGYPGIDLSMLPIIVRLNEIQGVVTTFCCQGHSQDEPGKYLDKPTKFYIMLVVTGAGNDVLQELFAELQEHLVSDMERPNTVLNMSAQDLSLIYKVVRFLPDERYPFQDLTYNAVRIEARQTNVKKTKTNFLNAFYDVLLRSHLVPNTYPLESN